MKKAILIFTWVFSLLLFQKALAQTVNIRGKITEAGIPLPGVGVKVKNSKVATVTDSNGEFLIKASGTDVLILSFIGFSTKEVSIKGRTFITESMEADKQQLDEVLVVGYGVQKKITSTGAITSVSGADLVRAPVAGISNALIGLSSGIQAIQSSGEFGSDKAQIRIRGMATLNAGGRDPLIMVDGVERETYNNIDPNEIESINILKDASSTAVYGVRGANGVIIITTKQGKIGTPVVNFTGNVAAVQPIILPKYLNSYDYAVLRNEAETNMGKTPTFSEEDLRLYKSGEDPIFHPSKDWIKELISPVSFQQRYNANISGGTEKLRYFTSFGYFNQGGAYNQPEQDFGLPYKHKYDNYTIRMNFDFDLTKDLSMSVKLGEQITDNVAPNGGAYSAIDRAANASPMSSPAFVDGKYIEGVIGLPSGVPHFNPWGQPGLTSSGGGFITEMFANTLNTNLSINYKLDRITRGLSVRAMGAYDTYYLKTAVRSKYFPAYTVMKNAASPGGYILYQSKEEGPYYGLSEGINDSRRDKFRKMYGELAVDYKRSFEGGHNVSGLLLANLQKAYFPDLAYKLPTGYLGFVSRVTYDYKNRYLAEFNMGYNGSENFPEGKRFGLFPSYSLGWVATEEPFIGKNKWLSFLKIRGSYGEVGNDKIGGKRYLYLDGPYALGNGGFQKVVFGQQGTNMAVYNVYTEGALGNPDVTWETAVKYNIGAELRFFSDRLSLTGDYFEEKRDNILWTLSTVPELVSAELPAANIGKVKNHGYELELGYKDQVGSLNYWLKGAYSFARNKIIYQDEPTRVYEWLQRTGRPIDQYFGLTFEGFYNTQAEIDDPNRPKSQWEGTGLKPGDMKYKDLNGDGKITTDDMGNIGYSSSPEINYSISGGVSWKGFDLAVLFQGTDHVSVSFSNTAAYPFVSDWSAAQEWHLERWTPERYANGDKIDFPRVELSPDKQHNYQPSSFWVQDASYFRFKNIELGYRFATKALQRVGLSSMRVFVSGNNLITWTDLKYSKDPDARELWGRVTPPNRVFNCGVNFQF
ncbi:TonB-linked SusC/RagA family outer membrane protein [Pedobacter sp. AK017]|uniref:SusC/RagA family TonB-linked outer membrane protein n=1 Tax=Pedobacter sp. AK017 TaxID=2723073 RepID=UPI00161CB3E0|nr:TonB-dependent receptor [Pedobacter sp. AK017]MBB5438852.1 TonB-linked SusC/RagA family outer membrane protein [Pedobacter sp. AK017]